MSGASTADAPQPTRPGAPPDPRSEGLVRVIGLGNPLLGDDGVGWRVVDAVRAILDRGDRPATPGVTLDCLAVGGLTLMEQLVGARSSVLVDAVTAGADPLGTVRVLSIAEIPAREATHLDSAHDLPLAAALATGRALGADLPDEIAIVTIEARVAHEFSESMSPEVERAVPIAAARVVELLAGR